MIVKANPEGYIEMMDGVWLKTLVHGEKTHLTHVVMKKGAVVPEHAHPHEQTGTLISGSVRFFGEGEDIIAAPGDSWRFHGSEKHGAEALEDSILVEVFSPVREDYLKQAVSDKQ
jgi:quercetin dioxygenase-like cupin family protein